MGSTGFSPDLFLYQEQANSKSFKDIIPFFQTPGSRHGISRSTIDVSRGQSDLCKLRSGLQRYHQFINYLVMRRMSLPAEYQDVHNDSVLSNHKEFLEFLMSASSDLREYYPGPSIMSQLREFQAIPTDMHLQDVTSIKFQLHNCVGTNESFPHAYGYPYHQENDYDFSHDVPNQSIFFHPEGSLSLVDTVSDIKDLGSILAEFAVVKDSAQCTKQQMLVPHFTWSNAIDLQNHVHPSLNVESVTSSLKSPKRVKQKSAPKRKTKKATTDRNLYRTNSLHAFETILSLMMDKNRNGKSMMSSLKKSSPEVPQLLTQFSASITGTGLAVMFSVVYKVACGTVPFSMSNVLTSGFGVGLFWLSWAVNRLRDTIMYIHRNFSKMGFEEEDQMMTRVDESVKVILFRVAALMAVLILRFA